MFTYKTESVAINFAKFLTSSKIFPSLSPFTLHYSMPYGYSYSSFYFDSSSPYLPYYKFVILSHLIHIFHTQKGDFSLSLSLSLSLLIGEFLISLSLSPYQVPQQRASTIIDEESGNLQLSTFKLHTKKVTRFFAETNTSMF